MGTDSNCEINVSVGEKCDLLSIFWGNVQHTLSNESGNVLTMVDLETN